MKKFVSSLNEYSQKVWVVVDSFLYRNANLLLFILGSGLLVSGIVGLETVHATTGGNGTPEDDSIDTCAFRWGVCQLYRLIEGDFGALLATVAGVLAIVASSVGSYSAAYTLLTVALGCFILRALVSLWFGVPECPKEKGLPTDCKSAE